MKRRPYDSAFEINLNDVLCFMYSLKPKLSTINRTMWLQCFESLTILFIGLPSHGNLKPRISAIVGATSICLTISNMILIFPRLLINLTGSET